MVKSFLTEAGRDKEMALHPNQEIGTKRQNRHPGARSKVLPTCPIVDPSTPSSPGAKRQGARRCPRPAEENAPGPAAIGQGTCPGCKVDRRRRQDLRRSQRKLAVDVEAKFRQEPGFARAYVSYT